MRRPRYQAQWDDNDAADGGPVDSYIGLGANLGDRALNLKVARTELEQLGDLLASSSLYETEPWDVPDPQPAYLNQVCQVRTDLPPSELMNRLLQIETKLGRTRTSRNAARPIDLDLLMYGDRRINMPGLEVPHPRMAERAFVLAPFAEIAPDIVHPLRDATAGDLLRDLDMSGVAKYGGGESEKA